MTKLDAIGISAYYDSIPHGEKGDFSIEVCQATGLSFPSVQRKLKTGCWRRSDIDAINKIIEEKGN